MTDHRPSRLRLVLAVLALALALASCSSGETVPEDQELRPTDGASGWTQQELAGVTFATPPAWSALTLPDPDPGSVRAGFAESPGPSGTTGGIVVMVIAEPRLPARTQTQTFVTGARNREQATDEEMVQITWPGAESAWLSRYTAQVGSPTTADHPTAHLVLDLENGYQVQATVRAEAGTPAAEALEQALATIRVSGDVSLPEDA